MDQKWQRHNEQEEKTSQPLTPKAGSSFKRGETPYDDIFECERRFGHMKKIHRNMALKPRLLIYKILKQMLQEHMYFLAS